MPVYTNSSTQNKYKNRNLIFKLGLVFLVFFSVLFINLLFNIVKFINSFLLGFFGLSIYAILLCGIIFSVLMLLNKKPKLKLKLSLLCVLSVFLFISIIHVLTTKSYISQATYGEYLSLAYKNKITAGGLLASIFVYLVNYITSHYISTICIYSIFLIISAGLVIYGYYTLSHNIVSKTTVSKTKTQTANTIKQDQKIQDNNEEILNNTAEESEIKEENKKYDDSIFVSDEKVDDLEKSSDNENSIHERLKAKSVLGLIDDKKEVTPEPIIDNNKTSGRPQKFVHNMENEYSFTSSKTAHNYPKKLSDSEKKSLEFLRATRGEKLAEMNHNQSKIKSDSNKNDNFENKGNAFKSNFDYTTSKDSTTQNKSNITNNFKPEKQEFHQQKLDFNVIEENDNDNSFDLYDDNLSMQSFKKNQDEYKNKFNALNNKINALGGGIKAAEKVYSGEANENIVESKSFNKPEIKQIKQEPVKHPKPSFKPGPYIKPPTDLLKYSPNVERVDDSSEQEEKAQALEEVLQSFKIPATVLAIVKGPTFTRYEMKMPAGIPVSRIFSYQNDIKMQLMTNDEIRIEAPIPGKSAFGIEVVNDSKDIVCLRDIIESETFVSSKSPLTFVLGKDIVGDCKIAKLDKAPHLLVAGSTGSGKSVCLNALIISLLYKNSPEDLKMILVDPKKVEMSMYNGLPHMLIPNAITEIDKAICAFEWLITEMERRYGQFTDVNVRDISSYNQTPQVVGGLKPKMPYLVLIVDEVADIMSQAKNDIENRINRLAAKSRAAGIHIVLATQRPSTDVITGLIKNNLPTRIAFKVTSMPDSKTILDRGGAEKLIGKGDMLFMSSDGPNLSRIQGALVSDGEVAKVTSFIRENNDAFFDSDIEDEMFNKKANGFEAGSGLEEEYDPKLVDALRIVIKHNNVSISGLQRVLSLGYPRAGKIVDQMERLNFISPPDNKNKRTIFITAQEFEEKFGEEL